MDSAYFSGRSGGEKNCFPKTFFKNLYPLCGPVAAKPLVLELLCLEVGTSVASALTAETIFVPTHFSLPVGTRGHTSGQNTTYTVTRF